MKGKSPTNLATDEETKCLLARYTNNLGSQKPVMNGDINTNGKDVSDAGKTRKENIHKNNIKG